MAKFTFGDSKRVEVWSFDLTVLPKLKFVIKFVIDGAGIWIQICYLQVQPSSLIWLLLVSQF